MIIVRPNNSSQYQPAIESLRAIEPPMWHCIVADYLNADKVLDLEVENEQPQGETFILSTGNNPTAFRNKLPMNPIDYQPRWELINLNKYRTHNWHAWGYKKRSPYGAIYTSISCPFSCKFCFSKDFYPVRYTVRPIKDVIDDFKYMGEHGVVHIKIMDELFIFNPSRVIQICKEIKKLGYEFNIWCYARIDTITGEVLRHMKQSGINWIAYGIESGNEQIRKKEAKGNFSNDYIKSVIKKTKKCGIKIVGNYMFGFEDDTKETMQETLDFAEELDCEYANFYCLIDKTSDQLNEDFIPRPTKTLSAIEVLRFRDKAFQEYYKIRRPELSIPLERSFDG